MALYIKLPETSANKMLAKALIMNGTATDAVEIDDSLQLCACDGNEIYTIDSLKHEGEVSCPWTSYESENHSGDIITPSEFSTTLPSDAPIIFKPNLNPDKIFEDLSIVKEEEKKVDGIPFWFVVYSFFRNISWLETNTQTKFIAWVETCFEWNRARTTFKRINPRFKHPFDEWPEINKTDRNYRALYLNLRDTFQQQKPNGDWRDKDYYYKKNKIHYNN